MSTGEPALQNEVGATGSSMDAPFSQGEFLTAILGKLKSVLANSLDENVYITGILTALCSFPVINPASRMLHIALLEPGNQFHRSKVTLIGHLKTASREIEYISRDIVNFEDALDLAKSSTNKYERFEVTIVKEDVDEVESKSEKTFVEGVLVFQEFIAELAGVIQAKTLCSRVCRF
jgi:hypothetical protein